MQGVDWFFWVEFGFPLVIGLIGGWWLRGVKAEDDARRIDDARWRHPSTMQWDWED